MFNPTTTSPSAAIAAAICLLAILVGSSAAQSNNGTDICTGIPMYTLLPDLGDCTKYFQCQPTQLLHLTCQSGYSFDRTIRNCRLTNLVTCFTCPTDAYFIDMPVDYECLQFVRCFAGRARQHTCSRGLLFDPVRRQCNFQKHVQCACPETDIPARPFIVRDWNNCAKYEVCAQGQRLNATCATGLHFNIGNQQCDHPQSVDCNGPHTTGAH